MTSQDPARFATPDLDDPSTWEVARSLPTYKDQTNKILDNHTNLGAHFGSGRVRPDLSTGVEFSREQLDSTDIDALARTAGPADHRYKRGRATCRGRVWKNGAIPGGAGTE